MISQREYTYLASFLRESSGLNLGSEKEYLVESRLNPLAGKLGFSSTSELIIELMTHGKAALAKEVTEAMTTPESLFFRDGVPFEVLRKFMLPALFEVRKERKRIRILSSACSTGQEPYSISILLEMFPRDLSGWEIEIIATDVNTRSLNCAREGCYTDFEVRRGLSTEIRDKYFEKMGKGWRVKECIRRRVKFQELNLIKPFKHLGTFDIIFCRNVLIYFDSETKKNILKGLSELMSADSYLVLGAAETVIGYAEDLVRVPVTNTGIYQKKAWKTFEQGKSSVAGVQT